MPLLNAGLPFLTTTSPDVGLSERQLRDAIHGGALRRVFRGVAVDVRSPDTRDLRLAAASLVLPRDAVVSDHSAAWLYGADTAPPGDMRDLRLMTVVPHGHVRSVSSRMRTRQTCLPDGDVRVVRGVAVTSPQRTAADLLRLSWRPYALAAGDALLRADVVDLATLGEYLAPLRRLPGLKQAKELAPLLDGRANRHGESWMRMRIIDAGLPIPDLDHVIRESDAKEWHLDSYFVASRLASEYDGRANHSTAADTEHDGGRRVHIGFVHSIRFVIAHRENLFGEDPAYELELGDALGCAVRPRTW
ncbi:hypothetical protein [Litorihabitans aurantiacus]|uniref:Transcriptional regulator, AbiEi antitoxin, Type IV TA system n=1 Tax=Litorihabitans aurantiacus TaxID=1930061 RepID=A0AA38CW76_9MICO|nr:hypothetical protein [Litorihabitans aurantiacus]GMA33355.1 hypothetical protein GCM10025875_33470 [Litorihabitans aurantiacus]